MKKLLLLYTFIFCSEAATWSQITITSADFPFVAKEHYQLADSSSVPAVSTNANAFWDLGSLQKMGTNYNETYHFEISNDAVFTTATEKGEGQVFFGPLPVKQNIYAEKSASGFTSLGIGYEKQTMGIGQLSGTATDSVTFPTQTYTFSSPFKEYTFPLTLNTQWASNTKAITDVLLTITFVGFNNTPAQLVSYFSADNEVVGYGTCRVPAKGAPGQTYDVLLLKTESYRVDSFYINGSPANPFLLNAMGLNQGDTLRSYLYRFLRADGGLQQMAVISFEDDSYTTVKSAEYSREFDVVSVGKVTLNSGVLVYPNPVTENAFTVHFDSEIKSPKFALTDITGKNIPVSVSFSGAGNYTLQMPASTAKGVYFLKVNHDTKNTCIKLLVK